MWDRHTDTKGDKPVSSPSWAEDKDDVIDMLSED